MVWPVVRLHVRPCGERVPLLVDRDIGVPLLLPAIYVMTALRSRAANTIAQHLTGVQVLLMWCHAEGISLDDRINSGTLFRGHELDGLWDATARPVADLGKVTSASLRPSRNVVKLGEKPSALSRETVGNRRGAVRRYLAWLSERRLFALRPLQISQLKAMDILAPQAADGRRWILNVPRLKQPGVAARTLFRARPITPEIGVRLRRQATEVQRRFDDRLMAPPMFPALRDAEWLPGYEWHRSATSIRRTVKSAGEGLGVLSVRTGDPLTIAPRRLRRSFGTRAASEGMGVYEVADLLDQSDTQNAQVYVEATSDIIERLDKALALKLAPLAQAFTGHFASIEELRTAPGGVVRGGVLAPPLGACGQQAFCGFAAPIACYTCRQFRAWRDGPHEAVLERLILERDRLQATTDPRIAAVNDRTILAVAEVLRLCAEAHGDG